MARRGGAVAPQRRTNCETKLEAKEVAREYDRKAEFHRQGIEPIEHRKTMRFDDVLDWYVKNVANAFRSQSTAKDLERYVRPALGKLTMPEITSQRLENFLDGLALSTANHDKLSPKSINNVRGALNAVFVRARKRGVWAGQNPIEGVEKRAVPKRLPAFLKEDEVRLVLPEVPGKWRAFFATAIYTGMRRGELAALEKSDIDLEAGTLNVARSWVADTTKGGRAYTLPIHPELRPYLAEAIRLSPSRLVFPREDGQMQSENLDLSPVLRTAMKNAMIVAGWVHKCRRCKNAVEAEDASPRHCEKNGCGMNRWAVAKVRPIRFHDLRHTTATLLLKAGVSLAVVQRVLRHSTPMMTAEVYGTSTSTTCAKGSTAPEVSAEVVQLVANSGRRGAEFRNHRLEHLIASRKPQRLERLTPMGPAGFEPAT